MPVLIAFASASGCVQAGAPAKACSPAQAEAADEMVDTLDNWNAVHDYARAYGSCDHGSIAEGSSEAVARLLADHWDTLPALARLVESDPSLKRFVLDHVNTTLDTNDLERIGSHAASSCPDGASLVCSGIGEAAARALK
ncbi:hypothetical protein ASG87_15135 [Frateuria sp. Soil773]|nr:hypothetical protein ASG87_15135 [Frateuria sp. Soil773]